MLSWSIVVASARKGRKPMAADRTIDMYTGKSKVDMLQIGETTVQGADIQEEAKADRSADPKEDADRWLNLAMQDNSSFSEQRPSVGSSEVRFTMTPDQRYLVVEVMDTGSYRQVLLPARILPLLTQWLDSRTTASAQPA